MKFIVDAQLPRALAKRLKELGHDAKHTWGLEDSNRTPDTDIARIADRAQAVVITKDCDFLCILKCLSLKMSAAYQSDHQHNRFQK